MLNKAERDNLRRLAQDCPQGRWIAQVSKEGSEIYSTVECPSDYEHSLIATCGVYDANKSRSLELARDNKRAKYIAAARPEIILKLLDMVDSLEGENNV